MLNNLWTDRPKLSKWIAAFAIIALTFFIDPLVPAQGDQASNEATSTMLLSTRLDTVCDSLDSLLTVLNTVEDSLKTDIDTSTKRLSTRLDTIENSLNNLSKKIDSLMVLSSKIDALIKARKNTPDQ